jgi:peroxiredoxin family protein
MNQLRRTCIAPSFLFRNLVKSPAAGVGAVTTSASATAPAARKGATIVVFSQDYDKVLGAFVIANGAAAMGGEVTMFFTFWGLNVLRDPTHVAVEAKPLMDRMFGAMMPKGVPRLGLSQMNFLGAGPAMLRGQMAAKGLPSLPGLMEDARRQGVRMVACTMSMEAMGIGAKELVAGVELGGVAEYLGRAEKAGTNLFI